MSDLIQLGEYLLERYGMTSWPADADEALTVAVQASRVGHRLEVIGGRAVHGSECMARPPSCHG